MTTRVVVDCAGAVKGGAARFLRELQKHLHEVQPSNVDLIGSGKQLTPQWLLQREWIAASAKRRISLNNAGFVNPRGKNITLLRNILQFATETDLARLSYSPNRRLRAQTPMVRALARASETLVVPCTRMAQQVETVAPYLKEKLTVQFHPVSKPLWAGQPPKHPRDVLLPIVPSPYKHLEQHIPEFLDASESQEGDPIRLIVPSSPDVFPQLASHPRIKLIGSQTSAELDQWWRDSGAVFFPTEFEAFGYPLAEARVYGRNVIAQDFAQNHEIAGSALKPYTRHASGSLREAIRNATSEVPKPQPGPFDPDTYFGWLLGRDAQVDASGQATQ
ncbi:MAG: hypothetical protein ACTHWM_06460 [Yaniella sp.]|uniref:hypothetical protein n=1 Tax=Yaniella sp. TaxID=2773929 RepID=UPI003F9EB5E3